LSNNKEYDVGDLIRWYEDYHDMAFTKDGGVGIILEKHTYKIANTDSSYTNYKVHRNEHSDTMAFEARNIERINK